MKQVSGQAFGKLIQRKGWMLRRVQGSHHIFTKPGKRERLSVPVHGNTPLKIGLLKRLMKVAEVREDEL